MSIAIGLGATARAEIEPDAPRAAIASEAASPVATGASAMRQLDFDVFLDERPIGYQRFELTPTIDGLSVDSRARFELTILRIKALDYDHHDRERWRGGCLQSIDSRTRQNGKDYRVTGSVGEAGFTVEGEDGRRRLAPCIGTFSYWDKQQLLRQKMLLNSQTGEYVAVETKALGSGTLRLGEQDVAVDRFVIRGEDLEITLAYARDSGDWLALDSPLFAGRTLRYRRRAAVPAVPAVPAAPVDPDGPPAETARPPVPR